MAKIDVYAIGVILLELALKEDIFQLNEFQTLEEHEDLMLDKVNNEMPEFAPPDISGPFQYVIKKMVERDPEKRHDFDETLEVFRVSHTTNLIPR
jgi:hypothetical protein